MQAAKLDRVSTNVYYNCTISSDGNTECHFVGWDSEIREQNLGTLDENLMEDNLMV